VAVCENHADVYISRVAHLTAVQVLAFSSCPANCPGLSPATPFTIPPWAEHLVALEHCFVMGVDLLEN